MSKFNRKSKVVVETPVIVDAVETPVVEVVETPVIETIEVETPIVDEVVETVVETPIVDETVEVIEGDEVVEGDEVTVRRHMTTVVKGFTQNGVRCPAVNGLCHAAWRLFDSLTVYEGDAPKVPTLMEALIENAKVHGLNPGNLRVEYPHWKKFNYFA
jgi:hypothetical protein